MLLLKTSHLRHWLLSLALTTAVSPVFAEDMRINPYPPARASRLADSDFSANQRFKPDQAVILELLARQAERRKRAASRPLSLHEVVPEQSQHEELMQNAPSMREVYAQGQAVVPKVRAISRHRSPIQPEPQTPETLRRAAPTSLVGKIQKRAPLERKPAQPAHLPPLPHTARATVPPNVEQPYVRRRQKTIPIAEWGKTVLKPQPSQPPAAKAPKSLDVSPLDVPPTVAKPVLTAAPTPQLPPKPADLASAPAHSSPHHVLARRKKVTPSQRPSQQPNWRPYTRPDPVQVGKHDKAVQPLPHPDKAAMDIAESYEKPKLQVPSQTADTLPLPSVVDEASKSGAVDYRPEEYEIEKLVARLKQKTDTEADPEFLQQRVADLDSQAQINPAYVHEAAIKRGLQAQAGQVIPSSIGKEPLSDDAILEIAKAIQHETEMLKTARPEEATTARASTEAEPQSFGADKASPVMSTQGPDAFGTTALEALPVPNVALDMGAAFPPAWSAQKGQSAYKILSQWSRNAGVDLIWNSQFLVDLHDDIQVSGAYEDAVQQLLMQYEGLNAGVHGSLFIDDVSGKKTLVIETNRS